MNTKKWNLFDVAVGSLAGTGVWGKLHNIFNNRYMQTDLITTVGFEIASMIAGAVISVKCTDWCTNERGMLCRFYERLTSDKYASPKED